MRRFDGGVFFGREPKYGVESAPTDMIGQLDRTSTSQALLTHTEAIFFDMYAGNDKTLSVAQMYPGRFIPLAVLNPLHIDPNDEAYVRGLPAAGFRVAAFFPYYQTWNYRQRSFRALLKVLDEMEMPVQLAVSSLDELSLAAEAIAGTRTPVLLRFIRGGGYLNISEMIAIASQQKNVFFDVSNAVAFQSVAFLADKIGAHRLYCASNSPFVYEACAHLLVDTAVLGESEKDQIRFGTLAALFGISDTGSASGLSEYEHELARPKIDTHWHGEGWDIIEPGKTTASLIVAMDQFGYEAVVTSSILALNYDMQAGNKHTKELTGQDKRIFGYVVVDPTRPAASLQELETYKNDASFVGIKTIQDYYGNGGIRLDDERYRPILEWAEQHAWPVLCHRLGVAAAAKEYPGVTFIAAHITRDRMDDIVPLRNVFADISGSYAHRGETDLRHMADALGADRILFAVDGPLMAPVWSIGKVIGARLSEEEKEKIYHANALLALPRLRASLDHAL